MLQNRVSGTRYEREGSTIILGGAGPMWTRRPNSSVNPEEGRETETVVDQFACKHEALSYDCAYYKTRCDPAVYRYALATY